MLLLMAVIISFSGAITALNVPGESAASPFRISICIAPDPYSTEENKDPAMRRVKVCPETVLVRELPTVCEWRYHGKTSIPFCL